MARPEAREEDKVIETWESAVPGTIYVWVYDRREDKYVKATIGGGIGSKILHISRDDRKYNQEQVPVENKQHDPFTNGALRFKTAATRDETLDLRYHYTDEELRDVFEMRDLALFKEAITSIESELILRRLAAIGESAGTIVQMETLKDLITERYPIGGTQTTVKEMFEKGQELAHLSLR